ncbi:hypothetical protein M8J77_015284 [Diaphorina citri]|nr:hypothetical protein M8J77_015284 [Diaphorina citri]
MTSLFWVLPITQPVKEIRVHFETVGATSLSRFRIQNSSDCGVFTTTFAEYLSRNADIFKIKQKEQNSSDCGVFTTTFAEYLSRNADIFKIKQKEQNSSDCGVFTTTFAEYLSRNADILVFKIK